MLDGPQEAIRHLMRVPEAPEPPRGAGDSVQIFRASKGFYRYRLLSWGVKQLTGVIGIVFGVFFLRQLLKAEELLPEVITQWIWVPTTLEALFVLIFLVNAVLSWLLLTLDFRYRWYMVTDRSLRIRDGLWTVRERTMTFTNVQNISVRQGPLQRLFGIADLQVQSAGGGSTGSHGSHTSDNSDSLHIGTFRGVDNAEEIRSLILDYQRRDRTGALKTQAAKLKDLVPRPEIATADSFEQTPLAAARTVLAEARALRRFGASAS